MSHLIITIVLAVGLSVVSHPASAALVLNINPGDMTLSFSGTDTGTIAESVGEGTASWGLPGGTITVGRQELLPIDVLMVSSSSNPSFLGGAPSLLVQATTNGLEFVFQITPYTENQNITLTGTGTPFSYASLTPANKAFFESQIGETLVENFASTSTLRSDISISQVPSPSAMLLMGTGLLGLGWRKWSTKTT